MRTENVKLKGGRVWVPVTLKYNEDETRISMFSPYNPEIVAWVRNMAGRKWNPDNKSWSFLNNARNRFQLAHMTKGGISPYRKYDIDLLPITTDRPCYIHQCDMTAHALTRRQCIIAGEMGVGKTLAIIEAMERSDTSDWWYVAPKNALIASESEFRRWSADIRPYFMTYERFTKNIKQWLDGEKAPAGIVFDEASYLKNPNAQRTQAAMGIADGMREDHEDPYIILMTGTPAPKAPTDWWALTEIACPGFLVEGDIFKLREKLAVVVEQESIAGGRYKKVVSWKSTTKVCAKCGEEKSSSFHDPMQIEMEDGWPVEERSCHEFVPSNNEVARLYQRLKGLVMIKRKADCYELPEKIYQRIHLPPSTKTMQLAKLIEAKADSAAKKLELLRELSDGFQYKMVGTGVEDTCLDCKGEKQVYSELTKEFMPCPTCDATGKIERRTRVARFVESPKVDALRELLELHEDRIVIYAGFQASIDLCRKVCEELEWNVIKIDGRGVEMPYEGNLQDVFQSDNPDKIAVVAHPASGGMGLTFHKSPSIIYYSNDFNAQSRIQSEDRIHRLGMKSEHPTIYDLVHLGTDEMILDNLQQKRDLQDVTLGLLAEALATSGKRMTM